MPPCLAAAVLAVVEAGPAGVALGSLPAARDRRRREALLELLEVLTDPIHGAPFVADCASLADGG